MSATSVLARRSPRAVYTLTFSRTRRAFSTVLDDRLASVQAPLGRIAETALKSASSAQGPRSTWTREEIREIYNTPLMELSFQSATVHRKFHSPSSIQMCTLMNIKTGGCSEDCSYCAQSSRYNTGLKATKMSSVESVLEAAKIAKDNGSTRFCMGAAWRDMRGRKTSLKNVKSMVEGITGMGMEACVTLGMIDEAQAQELKGAGLTAYNHNVDTSREHYANVITTRSYDERLQTLSNVRKAGINVCSGGILGLGEKPEDHVGLLHTVSTLPEHPESFPVNALVPIKGTPMENNKPIAFDAILRTIATARLVMPKTIIRIAAGRITMSEEQQVLCFMAGANAIFTGEKMLTTDCNGWDEDKAMFAKYGLRPMKSYERGYLRELTPEAASEQAAAEIQAAPKSAAFTSLGKTSGLSATAPMSAPASTSNVASEPASPTTFKDEVSDQAGPHRGFSSLDKAAQDMSKSNSDAGGYSTETLQQTVPRPAPATFRDEVSGMGGRHRGFGSLDSDAQGIQSVGTSRATGYSTATLEEKLAGGTALSDAIKTGQQVLKDEMDNTATSHRGFTTLSNTSQTSRSFNTLPSEPANTPPGVASTGAFSTSTPTASATTLDNARAQQILKATIADQQAVFADRVAGGEHRGFAKMDGAGQRMESAPDWSEGDGKGRS